MCSDYGNLAWIIICSFELVRVVLEILLFMFKGILMKIAITNVKGKLRRLLDVVIDVKGVKTKLSLMSTVKVNRQHGEDCH